MSANVRKNFYEVLGIDRNATILDIRKAYKDLALKFHPDKNNDAGTEEKFKLIREAHNVLILELIDPVERTKFDRKLNNYKLKCSMCFATFALNADLAEHQRKFHQRKFHPFKCFMCLRSISKPFQCHFCLHKKL